MVSVGSIPTTYEQQLWDERDECTGMSVRRVNGIVLQTVVRPSFALSHVPPPPFFPSSLLFSSSLFTLFKFNALFPISTHQVCAQCEVFERAVAPGHPHDESLFARDVRRRPSQLLPARVHLHPATCHPPAWCYHQAHAGVAAECLQLAVRLRGEKVLELV